MIVMVGVKRVLDPQLKARVKSDGSGMDLTNAKMGINPFDENAIEEAIRLREAGIASEIITVSIGSSKFQESLLQSLAMGADRSIHVETDESLEPLAIAKIFNQLVEKETPGLVLMGKQAIDDDCNQTGQMLSALLNWPQSTFTSQLKVSSDSATAVREVDGGLETIRIQLPAVITVDLRLNEPRYATLPNVIKARKKPLENIQLEDLGLDLTPHQTILETVEPQSRSAGIIVDNVTELVDKLKNEAGVL